MAQCLVAWWLRCMPMGQCLAATHKWERSCIEGVPPPKGQRGLLVTAAVVGARSQMEVEELSDMLAHMYACQQAQPVLHPRVVFLHGITLLCLAGGRNGAFDGWRATEERGGVKKRCCPAHRRDGWHRLRPRCQQASGRWAAVVVVSSGSARQLQRRVLTDMRNGGGVGGRAVCSFVRRSSSGAASIPALLVHEASHPSAVCWCVGSGKEERGGGSSTSCE